MQILFIPQDAAQHLWHKVSTDCLCWDAIFPSSKLLSHFALIYYMVKTSFFLYSMGLHTEIHVVACVQIKGRGPPWGLLSMGATVLDRKKSNLGPFPIPFDFVSLCSFSWRRPQIVEVSVPTKPDSKLGRRELRTVEEPRAEGVLLVRHHEIANKYAIWGMDNKRWQCWECAPNP